MAIKTSQEIFLKAKSSLEDYKCQTGNRVTMRLCREVIKHFSDNSLSSKEVLVLITRLHSIMA